MFNLLKTAVLMAAITALFMAIGAMIGGRVPDGPGSFYPPTVLVDVPPDARVLHEEVFGPVAPVVRFESEEELLPVVNDTDLGLVSYLYTRDLARGLRLAERVKPAECCKCQPAGTSRGLFFCSNS